ncbi:hypothetical protein PINS_up012015 [Pythium insidiosum]|nr:hypothetical protein PINS_up012015 [Pythium insidiosum]
MNAMPFTWSVLLFCGCCCWWSLLARVDAVVNFPGVEFNAASGQVAHASSYYDYRPNAVHDTVFVPQNAIDGFSDESSWWSSGDERVNSATPSSKPYWQLNMTATPPRLLRIVIRWHGFLSPAAYRVRVSYAGENFQTIAVVTNRSMVYDRVDSITQGLDKVDTRFRFLRVLFDVPNACESEDACAADDGSGQLAPNASTGERVVYGIREFELWATGTKNAAPPASKSASALCAALSLLVIALTK